MGDIVLPISQYQSMRAEVERLRAEVETQHARILDLRQHRDDAELVRDRLRAALVDLLRASELATCDFETNESEDAFLDAQQRARELTDYGHPALGSADPCALCGQSIERHPVAGCPEGRSQPASEGQCIRPERSEVNAPAVGSHVTSPEARGDGSGDRRDGASGAPSGWRACSGCAKPFDCLVAGCAVALGLASPPPAAPASARLCPTTLTLCGANIRDCVAAGCAVQPSEERK